MTDLSNLPMFATLPVCFLGGLLLGFGYFNAVRMTADMIVKGGNLLLGIVLVLGRMGLLVLGFYLAAQLGALALLVALAGVLCAKAVMVRGTGGARI